MINREHTIRDELRGADLQSHAPALVSILPNLLVGGDEPVGKPLGLARFPDPDAGVGEGLVVG